MTAPNIVLVVADHAADDLREMRTEREDLVVRLVELNRRIALTETLHLIANASGAGTQVELSLRKVPA